MFQEELHEQQQQLNTSFLSMEWIRYLLPKRFMESDFVEHAVKLGLSEIVAGDLFNHLQGGKIFRDGEGFWQWL